MTEDIFEKLMTSEERLAWTGFKNVVNVFLGNKKCQDFKNMTGRTDDGYEISMFII